MKNLILFAAILAIGSLPFFFQSAEEEFGGADTAAKERIMLDHPEYEPWCSPIWEPPGGEVESLLFALQAAIGSGFVFYFFGFLNGRKKRKADSNGTN